MKHTEELFLDGLIPVEFAGVPRWSAFEKSCHERTIHPGIYDAMLARFKQRFPQYVRTQDAEM